MDLAERLADSLRRLRDEAGLTQKDLAKRLRMSPATLNRLERGDHNTTLKTLDDLCKALQCAPGELFDPGQLRLSPRRRTRPGLPHPRR